MNFFPLVVSVSGSFLSVGHFCQWVISVSGSFLPEATTFRVQHHSDN